MKIIFQKYKMLIPVAVLAVISLCTVLTSLGSGVALTNKTYGGFAAIVICASSFFAMPRYYKYVLATVLILGLLDFISFTVWTSSMSFYFNSLSIGFQPISFCVCVLTVILLIPKKKEVSVANGEQAVANNQKQFHEDVERFKNMFTGKSSGDLTQIISDKRFTKAANEAAQQILNDRQTADNK